MTDSADKPQVIPFARRDGAPKDFGDRPSYLAPFRERLQPIILEAFASDDMSKVKRRDLSTRVGRIVSKHLYGRQHGLNLVDQRNLVTDLVNWLELCISGAASKDDGDGSIDPLSKSTAPTAQGSGGGSSGPNQANRRETASLSKKDAGSGPPIPTTTQKAAPATQTPTRIKAEEAKRRIEPIVFERLDISAASRLDREEMVGQIGEIVVEVLAEAK